MMNTTSRSARSAGESTTVAPSRRERLGLGPRPVGHRHVVARGEQPPGHGHAHPAGADPSDAHAASLFAVILAPFRVSSRCCRLLGAAAPVTCGRGWRAVPPRYSWAISGLPSTSWPVPSRRTWPLSTTTACVAQRQAGAHVLLDEQHCAAVFPHRAHLLHDQLRSVFGSRPIDGSSSTTSLGSSIRQRANSTRRCWPPESAPALSSARSVTMGKRSSMLFQPAADLGPVAQQESAHLDVLAHGHVREQRVVLGHLHDTETQDLAGILAARSPCRRR